MMARTIGYTLLAIATLIAVPYAVVIAMAALGVH
jgi:hypothetical protein